DVADKIEIELVVKRRIDGVLRCDKEEGVAIRGRADGRLGADIASPAWAVVDDERLAQALRQPLAHEACDDVGCAASGESDDDAHRPRRIGLRESKARNDRKRGSARS